MRIAFTKFIGQVRLPAILLLSLVFLFSYRLEAQEKERVFSFHIGSGLEMGRAKYFFPAQGGNSQARNGQFSGGVTELCVVFKNKVRVDLGLRYNSLTPFYHSFFDNNLKNEFSPYGCVYKLMPINENLNLHLGGCVDWVIYKDQKPHTDEFKNRYQFGGGPLIGVDFKRLRLDFQYIPKFNEDIDSFRSIELLVQNKFTVKVMYDYLNFPRIRKKKNE